MTNRRRGGFSSAASSGKQGWTLVFRALLGGGLFAITGTLDGHLAGGPTAFSPRGTGLEAAHRFLPAHLVLLILVLVDLSCALLGVMGRRRSS